MGDRGDEGIVTRLEPSTGRTLDRVRLRPGLSDIAAGSASVWVANELEGTLTRIDASNSEPVATVSRLAGPAGVVVDGADVWVAEGSGRRVTRIDARRATIADRVPVDLRPGDLAMTEGAIWATNPAAGAVTRLDTRTRVPHVVTVGTSPTAIATDGETVFVLNDIDHSVSVVDARTGTIKRTLSLSNPVTAGPRQITPGGIAAHAGVLWLTVESY